MFTFAAAAYNLVRMRNLTLAAPRRVRNPGLICSDRPTDLSSVVYPRMRGGTLNVNLDEVAPRGLSPHARGNLGVEDR
jgi:hypothetical protein